MARKLKPVLITQWDICTQSGHKITRKPHRFSWADAEVLYCEDCKIELGTISETKLSRERTLRGKKT